MIYMVDHIFTNVTQESAWHEWYSGYLRKLLSVPGLTTAQRFKAVGIVPSRFLAMYSVDSPALYDSAPYKGIGGGGSQSARFHQWYQIWTRNLFDGLEFAPRVSDAQFVFALDSDAKDSAILNGIDAVWLEAVGLHMTTRYRALAILDEAGVSKARQLGRGFIYTPFTPRLTPS